MLADIIANYLNILPVNANNIIKLLSFEKQWSAVNLRELHTQADFIELLKSISQTAWFKGHDRALLRDVILETSTRAQYYQLFSGIGLTAAIHYPANLPNPFYSVLFGSAESKVNARVEFLRNDLIAGLTPQSGQIFVLSCNRGLGISVPETEAQSQQALQKLGRDLTEMNMAILTLDTMLAQLPKQQQELPIPAVVRVEVVSASASRQDQNYVKTADTVVALKVILDKTSVSLKTAKPIIVAYSCQPHILRQQQDMQYILGDEYEVIGVGAALGWEDFNSNFNSISNCCGEISRLIYLNSSFLSNRQEFNASLTVAEQQELLALQKETP